MYAVIDGGEVVVEVVKGSVHDPSNGKACPSGLGGFSQ
jgi:hypothetical protein